MYCSCYNHQTLESSMTKPITFFDMTKSSMYAPKTQTIIEFISITTPFMEEAIPPCQIFTVDAKQATHMRVKGGEETIEIRNGTYLIEMQKGTNVYAVPALVYVGPENIPSTF